MRIFVSAPRGEKYKRDLQLGGITQTIINEGKNVVPKMQTNQIAVHLKHLPCFKKTRMTFIPKLRVIRICINTHTIFLGVYHYQQRLQIMRKPPPPERCQLRGTPWKGLIGGLELTPSSAAGPGRDARSNLGRREQDNDRNPPPNIKLQTKMVRLQWQEMSMSVSLWRVWTTGIYN